MIAALIGAGASILGGALSASGSSKAAKATAAAAERNAQLNAQLIREGRAQAERVNAPYANAGVPAVNALQQRVLPGSVPARAPTGNALAPAAPPLKSGAVVDTFRVSGEPNQPQTASAQFDPASYLQANPDVAGPGYDEALNNGFTGDLNAWAQYHYANHGQAEGRPLGAEPMDFTQDAGGTYGLPSDFPARPEFGEFESTVYRPTLDYGDFKNDPGYRFMLDEALKGATTNAFAGGMGRSGARLKALQDRAANLANTTFSQYADRALRKYGVDANLYVSDRDFQRANYDKDRAFGTGVYEDDRNFATGRFDRQTGDIFGLADIGQRGAAAITGAGQVATSQGIANNNALAGAQGNAALLRANGSNALAGGILQAGGMIAGYPWGGSSGGGSVSGPGWGTGGYTNTGFSFPRFS